VSAPAALNLSGEPPSIVRLARVNPRETGFMRHASARDRARGRTVVSSAEEGQAWAPLEEISPLLIASIVKAEDPRFFEHRGVDLQAIARKAHATALGRIAPAGASTISQQLARNLYLTPVRSVSRKVHELWLALRIDRQVSKARILELYLNLIEWGPGVWGCTEASARHLGTQPRDLDLFESTFLTSLVAAPTAALSGRNAVRSRYVQLRVTYQLLLSGLIDCEACAACCHRVQVLHHALTKGSPLGEALAAARAAVPDAAPAALREIIESLGIRPLRPEDAIAAHCGYAREREAWRRLRARFGQAALIEAIVTGNHAALREKTGARSRRPGSRWYAAS
jgi:membrane peptidoglycan carboxypeptidase